MRLLRKSLLLLALSSISILNCSSDNTESSEAKGKENRTIPTVEAVRSEYGSLPLAERLSGTVKADNQVGLSAEISGKIERVFVVNGQQVQKGDTLILLNNEQQRQQLLQANAGLKISQARVKQAEANLAAQLAQFKRAKILNEKELTSSFEFESAQAEYIAAQADLELAQAQLEQSKSLVKERTEQLNRTVIKAPLTGTVGRRTAESGMQVNQGTSLLTIGNLADLRIEVVLTEEMLRKIVIGMPAEIFVQTKSKEEIIRASISRFSPFLNETTRSTVAEIDLDAIQTDLSPGMFVPVDILYGESTKATIIPKSALFTNPKNGTTGVYLAKSLGSEIQPVSLEQNDSGIQATTEAMDMEFVEIEILARGRMDVAVNGIKNGNWVVTVGHDLIESGSGKAKVRAVSWKRVLALQQLQREDLLKQVLTTQTN